MELSVEGEMKSPLRVTADGLIRLSYLASTSFCVCGPNERRNVANLPIQNGSDIVEYVNAISIAEMIKWRWLTYSRSCTYLGSFVRSYTSFIDTIRTVTNPSPSSAAEEEFMVVVARLDD